MKQYIRGREYDFKNGIVYKDGNKLGKRKRDWLLSCKYFLELAGEIKYESNKEINSAFFPKNIIYDDVVPIVHNPNAIVSLKATV